MRVVVTGGAGFIGANLVRHLTERGDEDVVVIDDLSTGDKRNLEGVRCEVVEGTILDPALLDEAFAGADAVVHLAAIPSVAHSVADPVASHHTNVTGTVLVLEAARRAGSPHVVVASSSAVYGAAPGLPKHEGLRPDPTSPYGVTKLATEAYTLAYARCFGLDVLPFRFFNVFGPLQPADHAYAAVIPAFVDAALAGRPLPLYGDGRQTRDFIYVANVAAVIADALRRRVTSDTPVNLAFGVGTTLLELVRELEHVLGHPLEVEHRPVRSGDVPHSLAAADRQRELFPAVTPVPLRVGLQATVDWFRRVTPPNRSATGPA